MNYYKIKSRNWNSSPIVYKIFMLTRKLGVSAWQEIDLDCKVVLETKNHLKAWLIWLLFMGLKPLSGGWTYIIRPGHALGEGYKSIY